MKRALIVIAIFAVNFSYSQIQIGLKSGLNLATVRDINAGNTKARVGWNAGFLAEIPVQQNVFITPELLY